MKTPYTIGGAEFILENIVFIEPLRPEHAYRSDLYVWLDGAKEPIRIKIYAKEGTNETFEGQGQADASTPTFRERYKREDKEFRAAWRDAVLKNNQPSL